jgi:ubiquinone/menaquinone biosynthesis C-methylase UbiE
VLDSECATPPDTLEISARHYFWKLRLAFSKAIELRAYQNVMRPGELRGASVLDLGCSDGVFTRMLGEAIGLAPPRLGADRDLGALRRAVVQRVHGALVQADAGALPLRSGCFDVVLANGVLAHVRPRGGTA